MHYNREILSSVLRDMEREHTARTELFAQRCEATKKFSMQV